MPRRGFTLVELLAVMAIITIILGLILIAAMGSIRTAEEKATQTLISKLENGINDRLDALLQNRQDPSFYHRVLAYTYGNGTTVPASQPLLANWASTPISTRDLTFAMTDYLKRELPDVFFVQTNNPGTFDYPLNFAANLFPDPNATLVQAQFVLPLGSGSVFSPSSGTWFYSAGQGIYGASYTAAAGLYKNLGYLPTGYDGVDNTGDGLIDEWQEGVNATNQAQVLANLANHQHKTARSEVLYALLVEGSGPFGSIFNRDDFTDKEVRDTDGDGMPEFVDAWGQPLQFYRWPFLYHTDAQRGQKYLSGSYLAPYETMIEEREQNPLDLNQTLMAPAWWADLNNNQQNYMNTSFPMNFTGSGGRSAGVNAFEFFFHSLHEPMVTTSFQAGGAWDRGAGPFNGPYAQRRAYYSKPLIVSWGPDKLPGIFGYYQELNEPSPTTPSQLLVFENPAAQNDWPNFPNVTPLTLQLQDQGADDISNQTLQAGGGGSSAP